MFRQYAASLALLLITSVAHAATPGMRGTEHFGFTVPDAEQAGHWPALSDSAPAPR